MPLDLLLLPLNRQQVAQLLLLLAVWRQALNRCRCDRVCCLQCHKSAAGRQWRSIVNGSSACWRVRLQLRGTNIAMGELWSSPLRRCLQRPHDHSPTDNKRQCVAIVAAVHRTQAPNSASPPALLHSVPKRSKAALDGRREGAGTPKVLFHVLDTMIVLLALRGPAQQLA